MTGGHRRRSGAFAALAATLLLVLAPGRVAAQEEPVSPPLPPTMTLGGRSDWVADTALELDVALEGDLAGTSIRVRVHRVLRDALELAESQTEDVGVIIAAPGSTPIEELPVVADGVRRVTFPAEFLGEPGVHPVVVELVASDGTVLDTIRTPVVRLGPEDDPLPGPQLSFLVDVAAPPTLRPDGRDDLDEASLARFARLAELLGDPDVPATLLPVPETVEALTGSVDPRSSRLLASMAPSGGERPVVLLPYVPTSARSLTDAGLDDALGRTRLAGAAVLDDAFGPGLVDQLWPDDDVDEMAAALLAAAGITHVLVDAAATGHDVAEQPVDADSDVDDALLAPSGPRPVPFVADGRLAAVVVDGRATARLLEPADDGADAGHVVLADLLLRDDGRDSGVAVRVDDLPEDSRLRSVLPLLLAEDSPVRLVPLDLEVPDPDAAPIGLAPREEPDLAPLTDAFTETASQLAAFDSFVGPDSARAVPLGLRLVTSLGAVVSTDERIALVDSAAVEIREGFDAVTLTGQTDLNLTSRRGSLPINVTNDNTYPVALLLRVRSDRLRFPEGEELTVTLEPGTTRVDVPVEALTTGSVPTFVEVWTPEGEVQLDARQLNVRSTAFSGVGIALSLGALAVLGVWWIRSWRTHRRATSEESAPPG